MVKLATDESEFPMTEEDVLDLERAVLHVMNVHRHLPKHITNTQYTAYIDPADVIQSVGLKVDLPFPKIKFDSATDQRPNAPLSGTFVDIHRLKAEQRRIQRIALELDSHSDSSSTEGWTEAQRKVSEAFKSNAGEIQAKYREFINECIVRGIPRFETLEKMINDLHREIARRWRCQAVFDGLPPSFTNQLEAYENYAPGLEVVDELRKIRPLLERSRGVPAVDPSLRVNFDNNSDSSKQGGTGTYQAKSRAAPVGERTSTYRRNRERELQRGTRRYAEDDRRQDNGRRSAQNLTSRRFDDGHRISIKRTRDQRDRDYGSNQGDYKKNKRTRVN